MSTILDTLVTDRTLNDVLAGNDKGVYHVADLNRVESAINYVAALLSQVGHPVNTYSIGPVWETIDVPKVGDSKRIIQSVKNIREAIPLPEDTPDVPGDMVLMNYEEANAIEKILLNAGKRSEALSAMYLHCNEANCGYDGSDLV